MGSGSYPARSGSCRLDRHPREAMATPSTGTAPRRTVAWTVMGSPVDELLVAAGEAGLHLVYFLDKGGREAELARLARGGLAPVPLDDAPAAAAAQTRRAVGQLEEYFRGERRTFELDLLPPGTPFQKQVWLTLAEIPFGETWSYTRLAEAVGRPRAGRAVGAANGANPLPVILPCHRVIGADGSLTGYGGGVDVKRALLDLERGARSLPL